MFLFLYVILKLNKGVILMKELHFKNLDIKIKRGELIGVVGPTGSGKTYLLKMLSGRVKNNCIYIDNKMIDKYNSDYKKNNIVTVFNDDIYNTDSVNCELKYYLERLNVIDIENRLNYFKDYFNLDNIYCDSFDNLSISDSVYIKILSLLIINPCIFAIDDLLTYLNNERKNRILNYIIDNNITLINITTNMEELTYMDKVLIINKGTKEIFDKTEVVLNNENVFNSLGLSLPFIYDINNLLKSYDLINENHIIYKELVDVLWK